MVNNRPVHVLTSSYNAESYIHLNLFSILEQDYNNIKAIIVDDGSTDSTKEILRKFSSHNTNFKVFYEKNNAGIATRREQLIQISKQIDADSFFIWLDADDVINDKIFISRLMAHIIETKAQICLYNFSVVYENSSESLINNSKILLNDQKNSEKILSHIFSVKEKTVSIDSYPDVATFTSLGWTKAYAPLVKIDWPESDHRYLFEDFVYMSVLFNVERITALEPNYRPITHLRRNSSVTGSRKPEHFYVDVIQQLLKFKYNIKNPSFQRTETANKFIQKKLDQYETALKSLIHSNAPEFSQEVLAKFEQAKIVLM